MAAMLLASPPGLLLLLSQASGGHALQLAFLALERYQKFGLLHVPYFCCVYLPAYTVAAWIFMQRRDGCT